MSDEGFTRYIGEIVSVGIATVAGAYVVISRYQDGVEETLDDASIKTEKEFGKVWHEMNNFRMGETVQSNQIVVLQADQRHAFTQLEDIKNATREANEKMDRLSDKVTEFLMLARQYKPKENP